MKKLLISLANLALVTVTTTSVVACTIKPAPEIDPLKIGTNIKKLDDASYSHRTLGPDDKFTNYFVIGDSLSDDNGLTTLVSQKFSQTLAIPIPELGSEIPAAIKIILNQILKDGKLAVRSDFNLAFQETDPSVGVGGYGYVDENNEFHASFSNGPTAGQALNDILGFGPMKTSNRYSTPWTFEANNEQKVEYGRNYSIGGATAASVNNALGLVLNDVTIDKQAQALVSQHHIEAPESSNDLVFLEIGGNDLFALAELQNDRKAQEKLLNEAMQRLRNALFTLLNNGMENVIVGTPPDVSVVPRYLEEKQNNTPKFQYIQAISEEFNQVMLETIDTVKEYYPTNIQVYDIYSEFANLQVEHQELMQEKGIIAKDEQTNKDEGYTNSSSMNLNEMKVCATITLPIVGEKDIWCFDAKEALKPKESIEFIKEKLEVIDFSSITDKDLKATGFTGLSISFDASLETYRKNETDMPAIDTYFFTDFVHPTRWVHDIVANDLKELAQKF